MHKQVLNLFIIDLKHGELYLIFEILIFVVGNPSENFITSNWNDTFVLAVTHHGVTFS